MGVIQSPFNWKTNIFCWLYLHLCLLSMHVLFMDCIPIVNETWGYFVQLTPPLLVVIFARPVKKSPRFICVGYIPLLSYTSTRPLFIDGSGWRSGVPSGPQIPFWSLQRNHPHLGSFRLKHFEAHNWIVGGSRRILWNRSFSQLRHLDGIVTLVDAKHLIMHLDEVDGLTHLESSWDWLTLMGFA